MGRGGGVIIGRALRLRFVFFYSLGGGALSLTPPSYMYLNTYKANRAVIHPTTTETVMKAICLLLSCPPLFDSVVLSEEYNRNSTYK